MSSFVRAELTQQLSDLRILDFEMLVSKIWVILTGSLGLQPMQEECARGHSCDWLLKELQHSNYWLVGEVEYKSTVQTYGCETLDIYSHYLHGYPLLSSRRERVPDSL